MTKKIMTFVLEYEAGNPLVTCLMDSMDKGDIVGGVRVVSAAMGDELTRLEYFEDNFPKD